MKNLIIILVLLLPLVSCKKKLTQFFMDYHSEVIIPATLTSSLPLSLQTPEITTNSEAEFESHDTRKDKIESIYLQELTLTIVSPSNETFSFLNSVEIFVSSPQQTEQKVAFKLGIPANVGNVIKCDLSEIDLQEFIKDDTFKIRVKTVTDETIPQDVTVDVYSNFFVDAKLLK